MNENERIKENVQCDVCESIHFTDDNVDLIINMKLIQCIKKIFEHKRPRKSNRNWIFK